MSKQEKTEKLFGDLESAANAMIGCAMFAPESLRARDLERLINTYRDAEQALGDWLISGGEEG